MTLKKILLIDSKPNNSLISTIKNQTDHIVYESTDIKEIISTLYSKKVDIIILNTNFRIFDGQKILEILKRHKRTKNIPLIVLLPDLSENNIKLFYDNGADLCLGQPVLLDDIILSLNCLMYYKLKKVV